MILQETLSTLIFLTSTKDWQGKLLIIAEPETSMLPKSRTEIGKGDRVPINQSVTGGSPLARVEAHVKINKYGFYSAREILNGPRV